MELRQLRYFAAVAHESNFTRAAVRLRVAQPALSRQIQQLERELGVTLFERSSHGAKLTSAGSDFLAEAESVLHRCELAVRHAQAGGRPARVTWNVGYVWGLFHTFVPQWVTRFRQRHPTDGVNLFDWTATEQAAALVQGRLDAGFIGFAYEADAAGLRKRRVGTCTFLAALPKRHPAARKRELRLRMLAQDIFIGISERTYPGAAHVVNDACQRAGFRPRILQDVERGFTILGLVAANCGVTLLPDSLRDLPHPGVVFRPLTAAPRANLYVAWNEARIDEVGLCL